MKKAKVFYKYLCINHYDALASRRLMSTNSPLSTTQSSFQLFRNSCSLTLHHHVFRFLLCHILFYFVILGFHACRWVLLSPIAVFPASFSAPPVSNQLFTLPNIYTLAFPSVSFQIVFVLQVGKLSRDFLMICLQDDIYCVFQRFFPLLVFWLHVSHYSLCMTFACLLEFSFLFIYRAGLYLQTDYFLLTSFLWQGNSSRFDTV